MRCAIISDIHGNLDALETVLADAGQVDAIWCLGDLVGYGPQPNECIALLKERGALCVTGNHDRAAIGLMDTKEFNPEASQAALWTHDQLTEEHITFLTQLPEHIEVGEEGEFTIVHGSPREPVWEYLTHISIARPNFDHFQTRYCLVGHTHVPLIFERRWTDDQPPEYRTLVPETGAPLELGANRLIVNPGSVGQPRDGSPDAAYMVYERADGGQGQVATLTQRRITYPVASVQQKMREAGLPQRLITRLTYGW